MGCSSSKEERQERSSITARDEKKRSALASGEEGNSSSNNAASSPKRSHGPRSDDEDEDGSGGIVPIVKRNGSGESGGSRDNFDHSGSNNGLSGNTAGNSNSASKQNPLLSERGSPQNRRDMQVNFMPSPTSGGSGGAVGGRSTAHGYFGGMSSGTSGGGSGALMGGRSVSGGLGAVRSSSIHSSPLGGGGGRGVPVNVLCQDDDDDAEHADSDNFLYAGAPTGATGAAGTGAQANSVHSVGRVGAGSNCVPDRRGGAEGVGGGGVGGEPTDAEVAILTEDFGAMIENLDGHTPELSPVGERVTTPPLWASTLK